jgi:hypothetical protein
MGVITLQYRDNTMIRTQISLDEQAYREAKAAARRQGISLAEFLCRAVRLALPPGESAMDAVCRRAVVGGPPGERERGRGRLRAPVSVTPGPVFLDSGILIAIHGVDGVCATHPRPLIAPGVAGPGPSGHHPLGVEGGGNLSHRAVKRPPRYEGFPYRVVEISDSPAGMVTKIWCVVRSCV